MKIGQIPHLYRPHLGGIENYVYRLKNSLEEKGHEVTIYTTDLSIRGTNKREKNTFYCKTDFVLKRNPFSSELIRKIKETHDDIYHLHSPWFFSSLFAAGVLGERPKVMTVHSARIRGGGFGTFMLDKLYFPFAYRVLRKMDMLIALSEGERKSLLRYFGLPPESVVVIPNGIKIDEFTLDKMAAEEFVEKYRLKEDSFKVLSVGRLIPEKNPEKLISAVTKHMNGQNVEVIFIGGGDLAYLAKLKEMSDERIHIVGEVKFEDLVAAYHNSNLFVFLGTWEGIPTVILEAMLCGLPVVATPVGGIPEMITEENGLFVRLPISEEDLANKIRYFMDLDKTDILKISRANMRKIKTHYNWELLAGEVLGTYNQVLGG
jgi:glycosyltransferase involved in cell wall biosynthesis